MIEQWVLQKEASIFRERKLYNRGLRREWHLTFFKEKKIKFSLDLKIETYELCSYLGIHSGFFPLYILTNPNSKLFFLIDHLYLLFTFFFSVHARYTWIPSISCVAILPEPNVSDLGQTKKKTKGPVMHQTGTSQTRQYFFYRCSFLLLLLSLNRLSPLLSFGSLMTHQSG